MSGYTEEMLATWQDAEVRDIHQEMMQLTMRIVAKVLFDTDPIDRAHEVAVCHGVARLLDPPQVFGQAP